MDDNLTAGERRYQRLAWWTVGLVFLVILAGGIVRATGSGMGCPDWPKCFGRYIPPTEVSELPADYRTRYSYYNRIAEPFNAARTWTEYVNRLVTVVLGAVVLALTLQGAWLWRVSRLYFIYAFGILVLIGFQAWLGKVVVANDLAAYTITVHMLVALLIAFVAMYVGLRRGLLDRLTTRMLPPGLVAGLLIALLFQTALGTQIRESIDHIAQTEIPRTEWTETVGWLFKVHRTGSLVILMLLVWQYRLFRRSASSLVCRWAGVQLGAVGVTVGSGVVLTYLGFPLWAQPVHLVLGSMVISIQFVFCLGLLRNIAILPKPTLV
jgi:cytochrome c oxidase assembly protein subunit 15